MCTHVPGLRSGVWRHSVLTTAGGPSNKGLTASFGVWQTDGAAGGVWKQSKDSFMKKKKDHTKDLKQKHNQIIVCPLTFRCAEQRAGLFSVWIRSGGSNGARGLDIGMDVLQGVKLLVKAEPSSLELRVPSLSRASNGLVPVAWWSTSTTLGYSAALLFLFLIQNMRPFWYWN